MTNGTYDHNGTLPDHDFSYALLSPSDHDIGAACFGCFNPPWWQAAAGYPVDRQGRSQAEAQKIADGFADSELVMDDANAMLHPIDINNVSLIW